MVGDPFPFLNVAYNNDASAVLDNERRTGLQGGNVFFADLRSFYASPGMIVMCSGQTAFNDGLQGFFQFFLGDVVDDNVSTLVVNPPYWPHAYWRRINFASAAYTADIAWTVDGGGTALQPGIAGSGLQIDYNCTITAVSLLALVPSSPSTTGSIVVDIWKAPRASYPPTVANTITAAHIPTITNGRTYYDNVLIGWTTTINAGDTLLYNINSATTLQNVTITLSVNKS